LPEDLMLEALEKAHEYIRDISDLQQELIDKVAPVRMEYTAPAYEKLYEALKEKYYDGFWAAKKTAGKANRADACAALKEEARSAFFPAKEAGVPAKCENDEAAALDPPACETAWTAELFNIAWHELEERVVRDQILDGTRSDGRGAKDLRAIECKTGILPRVHGSALFQRGETQALITVTLGTARDEQRVEGLFDEHTKKFMLDYNFPNFSVGEVKPIRGPGRREYGHGALAERSVNPVIPGPDKFPYTIRIIADILESNGSSSMASVCGATLGLMAAGVPIRNPVAGISVGLVKEGDRWVLLTDIVGDEDHFGDMDFKVAGTQNGITGVQLDLKIDGINQEIIQATLAQSREARLEILKNMLSAIQRPAREISSHAPRLFKTKIDPDKIGALIGPGGKIIRAIQERTGALIEIDNDGTVTIASTDEASGKAALDEVTRMTGSVEVGKIYEGQIVSIKEFGVFVELLPGREGLCHVSELADEYVDNVANHFKVGDIIPIKVIAIDEQNRLKLSRKVALREMQVE
jgi:polyribonucleotide nucleotidyltransferase